MIQHGRWQMHTGKLSRVSSWKGRPVWGIWQQAPMKRTTLGCRLSRRCKSTSSLHHVTSTTQPRFPQGIMQGRCGLSDVHIHQGRHKSGARLASYVDRCSRGCANAALTGLKWAQIDAVATHGPKTSMIGMGWTTITLQ